MNIKSAVHAKYPTCIAFEVRGNEVSIVLGDFRKIKVDLSEFEAIEVTNQAEEAPATSQPKKKNKRTQL